MGVSWSDSSSSNGEVITPALLNNIRTNIDSYHSGGIPLADLAKDKSYMVIGPISVGDGNGDVDDATTYTRAIKAQSNWTLVEAQLWFKEDQTGSPTVELELSAGGTYAAKIDILDSGPLSASSADVVATDATSGNIVTAGVTIWLEVTQSVAGAVARNVNVVLIVMAEHTT